MRQAAISRGSSSESRRAPNAAVALDSSQRNFAVVSGWASCWSRYSWTRSLSVTERARRLRRTTSRSRSSASRGAGFAGEAPALDALGVAAVESVAVGPGRPPRPAGRLEFEHLSVLTHKFLLAAVVAGAAPAGRWSLQRRRAWAEAQRALGLGPGPGRRCELSRAAAGRVVSGGYSRVRGSFAVCWRGRQARTLASLSRPARRRAASA